MPSLYCFRLKGKFDDKNVYKFGKTNRKNVHDRLSDYSGLNKPGKIITAFEIENADQLEKLFLQYLKDNYEFEKELGKEYFYCNDEKELHKFIKELEIKYFDYDENKGDENDENEDYEKSDEFDNNLQVIGRYIKPVNFKLNGNTYNLSENSTWRNLILKYFEKVYNILDIDLNQFEKK